MKLVAHTLYPVSYICDSGKQIDALYTFDPSRSDPSYWVGEPIEITCEHIEGMAEEHKQAQIDQLREKLAKLEGAS